MELEGLKYLGAGLAVIGVIGAGIGIGNVFCSIYYSCRKKSSCQK